MDDRTFTACSDVSRRASRLLASHQDCLMRSQACLVLSRTLLATPVYPRNYVRPHDPFDFSGLKAIEPGD
jgi:hypothetical protein